jgi:hypothetical protein
MTWAMTEAQKTIYETLANDSALQLLLGTTTVNPKIFDSVPDSKPYPYVKLAIKPMQDRGNHTWEGVQFQYQIDVWYQAPGQGDLKVQQIQSRIDELLHKQDICIEGWNIVVHRRSTVDILDEPDGRTKHGVQIFNLFLGEA